MVNIMIAMRQEEKERGVLVILLAVMRTRRQGGSCERKNMCVKGRRRRQQVARSRLAVDKESGPAGEIIIVSQVFARQRRYVLGSPFRQAQKGNVGMEGFR